MVQNKYRNRAMGNLVLEETWSWFCSRGYLVLVLEEP